MMHTHLIEPMAPLVFRSGRPFGEGSRDGANFPWPSSLAGMFRTAVMDRDRLLHTARLAEPDFDSLQAMQAAGPFLARRDGDCLTPLLPKPADALYLLPDGGTAVPRIYRLRPGQPVSGTGSTLPNGLALVVLEDNAPKGKPKAGPEFWPLDRLLAWRRGEVVEFDSLSEVKPLTDTRTHVGINRISHAAADGKLFQVQGLDFGPARLEGGGFDPAGWVLLAGFQERLAPGAICLGGERRPSWLEPLADAPLRLPDDHARAIESAGGIALTLATPALFGTGWRPSWLNANLEGEPPGVPGLRLKLHAAAVERWQGISGWDLKRWQPKPARKAVATGATYWFEILGSPPAAWVQDLWLTPLSDDVQDRRDGYGLALPGPWCPHTPNT